MKTHPYPSYKPVNVYELPMQACKALLEGVDVDISLSTKTYYQFYIYIIISIPVHA